LPGFVRKLGRIEDMRVKIVTKYNGYRPGNSYYIPELYTFFEELPDVSPDSARTSFFL
jgi:hypothetical protein